MLLICKYDWRCSYSLIINVVPSIVFVDPCILRLTSISHWHTIIHVYLLQPYLTFYYRRVRIGIQSDYLYSSFNLSFQQCNEVHYIASFQLMTIIPMKDKTIPDFMFVAAVKLHNYYSLYNVMLKNVLRFFSILCCYSNKPIILISANYNSISS